MSRRPSARYAPPPPKVRRARDSIRKPSKPRKLSARKREPAYTSWRNMWIRCTKPNHHSFPRYGGRGIKVCDRWRSYDAFLADMGRKPADMTLDRIDNNGDYEPGNCRWATQAVQQRNRRTTKLTQLQADILTRRVQAGERPIRLAREYGVSAGYVSWLKRKVPAPPAKPNHPGMEA